MTNKLNKGLLKNVHFNPTKTTTQESIELLCSKIYKEEIVLPYFQTGIRWTDKKIIDLLNFQLNGYAPVSPISVNEITSKNSNVPQVTFIDRRAIIDKAELQNKLSVNDGQQRLTSNFFAYIDHPRVRNFVLDLHKGKFMILKNIIEIKNYQVPVGKLLNMDGQVLNDYKNNNPYLKKDEVTDLLKGVRSKLFSYFYTINKAQNLTREEQLDWFLVLNNAGSTISALQMQFSTHFEKGIDIHADYLDKFMTKINAAKLYRFIQKETEVSIPFATLNPTLEVITEKGTHVLNYSPIASDVSEAKTKELCALTSDKLKECFEITLAALDKAIDFIKVYELRDPTRMDYITFLTGLYVYNKNNEFSETQKVSVIEWYNNTEFVNLPNNERRIKFNELLKIRHIG